MKKAKNIEEAMRMTLAQIEARPESYRFTHLYVPETTNDVGCILGWCAHFLGERDMPIDGFGAMSRVAHRLADIPVGSKRRSMVEFRVYDELDAHCAAVGYSRPGIWVENTTACVATLRSYINTHWPATGEVP